MRQCKYYALLPTGRILYTGCVYYGLESLFHDSSALFQPLPPLSPNFRVSPAGLFEGYTELTLGKATIASQNGYLLKALSILVFMISLNSCWASFVSS